MSSLIGWFDYKLFRRVHKKKPDLKSMTKQKLAEQQLRGIIIGGIVVIMLLLLTYMRQRAFYTRSLNAYKAQVAELKETGDNLAAEKTRLTAERDARAAEQESHKVQLNDCLDEAQSVPDIQFQYKSATRVATLTENLIEVIVEQIQTYAPEWTIDTPEKEQIKKLLIETSKWGTQRVVVHYFKVLHKMLSFLCKEMISIARDAIEEYADSEMATCKIVEDLVEAIDKNRIFTEKRMVNHIARFIANLQVTDGIIIEDSDAFMLLAVANIVFRHAVTVADLPAKCTAYVQDLKIDDMSARGVTDFLLQDIWRETIKMLEELSLTIYDEPTLVGHTHHLHESLYELDLYPSLHEYAEKWKDAVHKTYDDTYDDATNRMSIFKDYHDITRKDKEEKLEEDMENCRIQQNSDNVMIREEQCMCRVGWGNDKSSDESRCDLEIPIFPVPLKE